MSEPRHTKEDLYMMQALPLDLKIRLTEDRIKAWVNEYGEDGVCVSFSGGKDSTVLLHIVRSLYPDVRAVFSNTGLEYPEIRQFAMSHDNVDIVYPEMRFKDVITQYGYPLISKEVAEAIYYARRIGGGGTHKETTTQTPWTPTRPNAENATKSMGGGVEELPQKMSPTESKRPTRRTVLLGQMGGVLRNQLQGNTSQTMRPQREMAKIHGSTIPRDGEGDTNSRDSEPG